MTSLNAILVDLAKQGCFPCISFRGNVWRAHVNGAGNFWADSNNPVGAMMDAIEAWEKAGKPMDGYADGADSR